MSLLNIAGVILFFGALTTPAIAYFTVLRLRTNLLIKIFCCVVLTIIIAVSFYTASVYLILGNDGLDSF